MRIPGGRILLGGRPVDLAAEPLKSGGQAAVFEVPGSPDLVVKVYRDDPTPEQERRLTRMMDLAPLGGRPTHEGQPPELAWPVELCRTPDGRFAGYAMRRFGEPGYVQLLGLFNRQSRLRHFPERADWRFLLGVSFNLSFMTARMHHQGLIVGDFSSNNVVVDRDGFITFLDCDSIGFTDPGTAEEFPCLMLTPEYCAPERQKGGPATEATDDFALAILIYQLLTAGNHPFGGVRHDSDSDTSVKDNIAYSASYVVRPEAVTVPRGIIDPAVLPPALLDLARRAFGPGVEDPSARPAAAEWLQALDGEWDKVRTCTARPHHTYGSHLRACPWCARPGQDLFNPAPRRPGAPARPPVPQIPQVAAVSRPDTIPPAPPAPFPPLLPVPDRAQAKFPAFVIAMIVLFVLLVVIAAIASGGA
ncbi:protein kinase domain-containing protein [Actinocorallia longicatena]|uniref:Protein kinase domain-containing protein n=1 Tax=Actinocorallia longicatena TaxID=111803 RepID=A0ABP6Q0G6_9ACTN